MIGLRVELTGADIPASIRRIGNSSVIITDLERTGEFVLCFTVPLQDFYRLRRIVSRNGDSIKIMAKQGFLWNLQSIRKRPVLMIGLSILLLVTLWVPGRIFFVQVSGNETVATHQIVEAAANCGIRFGASRRAVRSEVIKNALLAAMPQLQWAGVNTNGCVAFITVRERNEEHDEEKEHCVSSIVASRDGVIQNITVLRGNRLCNIGQAVRAGQVLVSGYLDCGIYLQATSAEAEVYAQTSRTLIAISPTNYTFRSEISVTEKKFSLIIGKKRINLCNSSGILGTSCAKIYEQSYLTLPGGFTLPISIVSETCISYDLQPQFAVMDPDDMMSFAKKYLCSQMIGGSILSDRYEFTEIPDACRVDAYFYCCEMIGVSRPEEILTEYESN